MMNAETDTPKLIRLDETISTNQYMRQLLETGFLPEGSVVLADFQSAGKGQIGNHWESEKGCNLTFSVLLYPDFLMANRQFLISQITALSVKKTLDEYVEGVTIKWPNDIYWQNKKICGMLIENDLAGQTLYSSILGIGININQDQFRSNAPNPVSLRMITGQNHDREVFFERFLSHFSANYFRLIQGEEETIRAEYQASLFRGQGFHPYIDDKGQFDAAISDIEPTGHLRLTLRNGEERRYAFKEVSVVL